jgi:cleavage and polyadenylation specificity factor subunit 1
VKHFRHMLEARHFTIFTDHKPLTFAFQQKRDTCSPRQFRHLDFIAQFTTDIRHISGQDKVVAEALSRVESVTASPSFDDIATAQDTDDDLRTLLTSDTALKLEKLKVPDTTRYLYCDISIGKPRPYVPTALRPRVFRSIHDLFHPGIKSSAQLVTQRFLWPSDQKDCRSWARVCQACQRAKVSRHTFTPVGDFGLPPARSLHVHRPCRTPPNFRRIHLLPHRRRSFHALAGGNPDPKHNSGNSGSRSLARLDLTFWLPTDHHH